MKLLLLSTYELGHQPLHLAVPAAAALRAGHEVRCLDLAVQDWPAEAAWWDWPDAVGISVPMHTAMRLGLASAHRLRAARPELPICLYGLYAAAGGAGISEVVDRAIAGEYLAPLLEWVGGATNGPPGDRQATVTIEPGRSRDSRASPLPARHLLPPLERYARLDPGDGSGAEQLVGYVEATRGCSHRCLHCPVPAVYHGRTTAAQIDDLLADVEQLVALGARHVSFGDPDFLNRPQHARRAVSALHECFPGVSFDCTAKVEHILRYEEIWPEMAAAGCLFVVSAFESVDDRVLALLDKGHSAQDAARAVGVLRASGIDVRPSFLPFTPWTTLRQVADLMDFVAQHDLAASVDPVQYSIRLLVPEGSLLLSRRVLTPQRFDPERLSWDWAHQDPAVEGLQRDLASLAAAAATSDETPLDTYERAQRLVAEALGEPCRARPAPLHPYGGPRPRLTEPWFCCAEPTAEQMGAVGCHRRVAAGGLLAP